MQLQKYESTGANMINHYKDLLLNIFFIFFPLVFYPYILKIRSGIPIHRLALYILLSVTLISIMSFPLNINGLVYDFRSIPLTIGFLYGGTQVSILLYFTLVIYRCILGSPNNLIYAVSLLSAFAVIFLYLRKFQFSKLYHKVINSVIICTLIKIITFTVYLALTHNLPLLFKDPLATVETYLLQGLLAGICVYLLESLNKYFLIEEEVIKSEKIKIVSDIAASVAHEIRNPLTSVRGFIQLLGSDNLSKEKRDYYQQICLEELDRAQHIISDYLSIAKPDPEHIEKIDIGEEVNYVSNILQTYANFNNVQINIEQPESLPYHTIGDRYKLRQALINIGKNAIEAMPDGGILQFGIRKANNSSVLTISDTGIGMTAQQINRLGTPYYSTKEKGTGLGTMVSLSIIKKMNGKVEIKSEVGKGTEYTITFPEPES